MGIKKKKKKELNFSLSNWTSCLIKHRVFTSKCVKVGLNKNMVKFNFEAFFTRVSKSLGCFTPDALKPSSLGIIGLTLNT
jgi:hypothetical protein